MPAKYLFVGISAGRLGALVSKVPLTKDSSGRVFQRCLKELGLSESDEFCEKPILRDTYITNLVKGRCLDWKGLNRLPTPKEVEFWWTTFLEEYWKVDPERVLALGDFVWRRLWRKVYSGRFYPYAGEKIKLVKHPRWYASHGALRVGSPAFARMVVDYRKQVFG